MTKMAYPHSRNLAANGRKVGHSWDAGTAGPSSPWGLRVSPAPHDVSRVARLLTWQLRAPKCAEVEASKWLWGRQNLDMDEAHSAGT